MPAQPKTWLVCPRCANRSLWIEGTTPRGCNLCGSWRYAEDDEGKPVIMWSEPLDPEHF